MAKKFDLSVVLTLIDQFSGKMKKIGDSTKAAGKKMTLGLTAPIAAFGALSIKTATTFQSSMNMVGAVTSATKGQFGELQKTARKLGATTQFSASQAAEAMKFMGMAGMNTNDIIGASPKVLQLAASAQLEMGQAADIVTNIMAGYKKKVGDLGHVNDVLVNAFTGSNVNLVQLGEAMKKVGPVASNLGFNFEETTAALGLLGSAGIQGSEAGTGLRRIMTQMANQTPKQTKIMKELGLSFKDANGDLLPLSQAMKQFEELQKKGASQTLIAEAALQLFGDRGGPQFLALLSAGSEKLSDFTDDLNKEGTAARVAKAQMEGLPGAFKLLASAFESVQLSIVESGLGEFVNDLIRGFASWLQKLSEVNPELLSIGVIVAGAVAALGPLLIVLGSLATLMPIIGAGITLMLGPIGLVILAVGALVAGAVLVYKNWEKVANFFSKIATGFKNLWNAMPSFIRDGIGGNYDSKAANSKTDVNVQVSAQRGAEAYIKGFSSKGPAKVNATTKSENGPSLAEAWAGI